MRDATVLLFVMQVAEVEFVPDLADLAQQRLRPDASAVDVGGAAARPASQGQNPAGIWYRIVVR